MTVDLSPPDYAAFSYRLPETTLAYREHRAALVDPCSFCLNHGAAHPGLPVVGTYGTMLVIPNDFPYVFWESRPVAEHLMVIPVRHLLTLAEMTDDETLDYVRAVREFEAKGFSVYTRAQANPSRSVGHLHTHLIST